MKAQLRKRVNRFGLTLIELVIVLAILAALAGLVLPLAGTYLEKAHAGAAASNFKEVAKVVQQYNTVTRAFPNGLDSLQSTDGVLFAANPANAALTVAPLTADGVAALDAVGINNLFLHDGGGSATFDSTLGPLPLAVGVNVAAVANPFDITAALGYTTEAVTPSTSTLVVFGFGHETTLIGEWMQEAPYHFPEEGNPNVDYNRFGLVFDIIDEDGVPTSGDAEVKFVGVVSFHEGELVGPGEPIAEFFE